MLLPEERRRAGGCFASSIAAAGGGDPGRAGVPLLVLLLEGETTGGRFALSIDDAAGVRRFALSIADVAAGVGRLVDLAITISLSIDSIVIASPITTD